MLKRIFIALLIIIVSLYVVLDLLYSGKFTSNKIIVEKQQIIFPEQYKIFQITKEDKLYSIFTVPFVNLTFKPTFNFESTSIGLRNIEKRNMFFINFAKYTQKQFLQYTKGIQKQQNGYLLKEYRNCHTLTNDDANSSQYIYS